MIMLVGIRRFLAMLAYVAHLIRCCGLHLPTIDDSVFVLLSSVYISLLHFSSSWVIGTLQSWIQGQCIPGYCPVRFLDDE